MARCACFTARSEEMTEMAAEGEGRSRRSRAMKDSRTWESPGRREAG